MLLPARTRSGRRPPARFPIGQATTGQELKEQVAARLAAPLDSFALMLMPAQPPGGKSGSDGGGGGGTSSGGGGMGSLLGAGLLAKQGALPGAQLTVRLLYLGARPGEAARQAGRQRCVVCTGGLHGRCQLVAPKATGLGGTGHPLLCAAVY